MGELKKISDKTSKELREEPKIIKDLVVGFLIIKSKVNDGSSYVNIVPLDSSWDVFNDDHDLDADEEIIGVIPAPQHSYKILGHFPCEDSKHKFSNNGSYKTLGYEYNGAYHPDWNMLLEEKINDKKMQEESDKLQEESDKLQEESDKYIKL